MDQTGLIVTRVSAADATWETRTRPPAGGLTGIATRYQDYASVTPGVAREQHPPNGGVTMIITLGPKIGLVDTDDSDAPAAYVDAFVAGVHDRPAMTESAGASRGVQVDLTAIGAYMLMDTAMDAVARRSISITDAFGQRGAELRERLGEAPTPRSKFIAIDAFFASGLARARRPSPAVVHAWRRLHDTRGRAGIGCLAEEIGWSRKHLHARFKEQVGLPPKSFARILRFRHVIAMLDAGVELPWSMLALRAGYYDQAHFNRDFRQFAGCTPGEFIAGRRLRTRALPAD